MIVQPRGDHSSSLRPSISSEGSGGRGSAPRSFLLPRINSARTDSRLGDREYRRMKSACRLMCREYSLARSSGGGALSHGCARWGLLGEGEAAGGLLRSESGAKSRQGNQEREREGERDRHWRNEARGNRRRGSGGGGAKRFTVAHIKESGLIESLRGVCSSLLIWLNIPD